MKTLMKVKNDSVEVCQVATSENPMGMYLHKFHSKSIEDCHPLQQLVVK